MRRAIAVAVVITLGAVSVLLVATQGNVAENGRVVFVDRELAFGEKEVFAENSPVQLVVECKENVNADNDEIRVLANIKEGNGFLGSENNPLPGPGSGGKFLKPDTPASKRVVASYESTVAGEPGVETDADGGFVASTKGEYLSLTEGFMLGLNFAGADCILKGHVIAVPNPAA